MKLILFDIDGTLLISQGIGREAKRRAMTERFGTVGDLDNHEFGGKTDWGILVDLLAAHALPGAFELLHHLRLRRDCIFGIVTGNTGATARIKLEMAGFDPARFIVGAYGHESPHRDDLARLALQRAESRSRYEFAPRDIIVIGDTPADVQCARAIDAVAVAVETGYAPRESLVAAKPDFLLEDLRAFPGTVL